MVGSTFADSNIKSGQGAWPGDSERVLGGRARGVPLGALGAEIHS